MPKYKSLLNFACEFVKSPRHTGAICPSSVSLARQMAAMVPLGTGKVIELGPGNGPMTRALLLQGVAIRDLILVERTQSFAKHLTQRFPGVEIIHGDACALGCLLGPLVKDEPIRAIVSSLPFRSMPRDVVQQISQEIIAVSQPGTRFIQFTYHLHDSRPPFPGPFSSSEWHIVWQNLPPARVGAFDWKL